jgi:hypothetical protein
MYTEIKENYEKLPQEDKLYAKTVVPMWIAWSVYLITGIPVGGMLGFL